MAIGAGHVGLVVGGKAHAKFWPEATRWAAERSTPLPEQPAPRAAGETLSSTERRTPKRTMRQEPRWWAQTR